MYGRLKLRWQAWNRVQIFKEFQMRFERVGQSFVAEVMDVDLGRISDSEFRVLYKAWLEFGVLRIRDQSLNDGELQRFSNRFGPLEEIPYGKISEEENKKSRTVM